VTLHKNLIESTDESSATVGSLHRKKNSRYCESFFTVTGQLSNHFVERMRKIYELELFIKLGSLSSEGLNTGPKR